MASSSDPKNLLTAAAATDTKDDDDDEKETTSYRDFSRVVPDKPHNDPSSILQQTTSSKEPTFPRKLHMILSNAEFQDIIAWLPHGRSWRILQQRAFEERVIPLYFRHGRYSSFARQVNGWGFRRITHGSDYNSYYHELFLRGMPHLCDKMRRLTTKDLGKRKKVEDGPTPDFYALSRENPLPESVPVPTTSLTPPAIATANAAAQMSVNAAANRIGAGDIGQGDVAELALLERRRMDIMARMNLLSGAQNQFGYQFGGQSDGGLNNNSLLSAAALSMGNAGRPNGLQGLMGIPGAGMLMDPAALQRQLLEARLANANMAQILGLQGGQQQQQQQQQGNDLSGVQGFSMSSNH